MDTQNADWVLCDAVQRLQQDADPELSVHSTYVQFRD